MSKERVEFCVAPEIIVNEYAPDSSGMLTTTSPVPEATVIAANELFFSTRDVAPGYGTTPNVSVAASMVGIPMRTTDLPPHGMASETVFATSIVAVPDSTAGDDWATINFVVVATLRPPLWGGRLPAWPSYNLGSQMSV